MANLTKARLDDLLPEMIERIAKQCHRRDLIALRLVSRKLESKTHAIFLKEHFSDRSFLLCSEGSLRVLASIVANPEFANALKHLTFYDERLAIEPNKCPWEPEEMYYERITWSDPFLKWAVWANVSPDQIAAAYQDLRRAHSRFETSSLPRELLEFIFGKLKSLVSIDLRGNLTEHRGKFQWRGERYPVTYRILASGSGSGSGSGPLEEDMITCEEDILVPRYTYGRNFMMTVLDALALRSVLLETLSVQDKCWTKMVNRRAVETFATHTKRIDQLGQSCSTLKRFNMTVYESVSSNTPAPFGPDHDLESMWLSQGYGFYGGHYVERIRPLLTPALPMILASQFSKLKTLYVDSFEFDFATICNFLQGHPTLQTFEALACCFKASTINYAAVLEAAKPGFMTTNHDYWTKVAADAEEAGGEEAGDEEAGGEEVGGEEAGDRETAVASVDGGSEGDDDEESEGDDDEESEEDDDGESEEDDDGESEKGDEEGSEADNNDNNNNNGVEDEPDYVICGENVDRAIEALFQEQTKFEGVRIQRGIVRQWVPHDFDVETPRARMEVCRCPPWDVATLARLG
ncbi:uncharacterized protein LTR77_010044 [Saxophila tyrrhenica]|uniref:F-box domain-containing protein n=1 Tax=Saxophila tyrrhenica TaxID=1690608 RepID=A0AAV9P0L3_9PEZI|nr:hypothetical protein LTR77_010044 [Saxophila tyrrhenica]